MEHSEAIHSPNQHQQSSSTVVEKDWQLSREARRFINCLFRRKARIQFGFLEQPEVPVSLNFSSRKPQIYFCRLLLYGKAGVGKTSTVLKLSGQPVPQTHQETIGIQTTRTYWPAKLAACDKEEIVLLHLELWDTGEKAVRKFEHTLPSMLSSTNAIAFFFSYTDRSSWNELPGIIQQATNGGKIDSHLKIVVGTRHDSDKPVVTQEDIDTFQRDHHIQVLSIGNINRTLMANGWPDGQQELVDIVHFLNTLTELVIFHQTKDKRFSSS